MVMASFDEMKEAIARFIHYYNNERLQSSLNYKSPEQFINDFNKNNYFHEKDKETSSLLMEVDLGSLMKLENINHINELCCVV